MKSLLLVGLGGAFGAIARYQLSTWVLQRLEGWRFPLGTFVVNVLGCLIAGLLAGLVAKHELFAAEMRLLLFTGVLGGFTTFSAFGMETVMLLKRGELLIAGCNVALSVVVALALLWLGFALIPGRSS
jgi:CrcB protein